MSATPDLTSPKPVEGASPDEGAAAGPEDAPKARGAVSFVQERFKGLVAEYGPLLFAVYFSIFGVVFVGSAVAIQLGFEVKSAAATAGVWTAAYVFTKVVQPLRIAGTIVLTPAVAALLRRFRRAPAVAPQLVTEVVEAPDSAPGRQRQQ